MSDEVYVGLAVTSHVNDRYWRTTEWREQYGANAPLEAHLSYPEPTDVNMRKEYKRALSYFYMIDTTTGRGTIQGSGSKRWITNLAMVKQAADRELTTDATLTDETGQRFDAVLENSANHAANHRNGKVPEGGDILFVDGHVLWRPFNEMEERYMQFWW
jgi:prepilin-type processing-associated H-X9-DG protein